MCWTGNPCSNKSPPAKQLQQNLPKFPFLYALLFSDSFPDGWGTTQGLWPVRPFLLPMLILSRGSYLEITNNWATLESFWIFWNLKAQCCCSVSLHQENPCQTWYLAWKLKGTEDTAIISRKYLFFFFSFFHMPSPDAACVFFLCV